LGFQVVLKMPQFSVNLHGGGIKTHKMALKSIVSPTPLSYQHRWRGGILTILAKAAGRTAMPCTL
jgi:hypothetical protein